ncbi:MAG: hypothetical protein LBK94_09515 [Prevotellaceae bacterium]|jgi:hypothetical protein|nr:hypothetical protein [Prevotellaceae bacterium]
MRKIFYLAITLCIATTLSIMACTNGNNEMDLPDNSNFAITANVTTAIINADLANQEYVINTYTTKLPEGVDSIQTVTNESPFYKKVLKSSYIIDKELDEANIAIYYYTNNRIALLARNTLNNIVYTYVIKADTKEFVDVFTVTKQENSSSLANRSSVEIQLTSSVQSQILYSYDGNESLVPESWGSRFKDALKQLYNDWDDDPVGTLACCVTTVLCAIGAAIWAIF